jgi:hypothetical protein
MRKGSAYILLSTCFFLSASFSQQVSRSDDPILFRGVVIDASNKSRLSNSQIYINRSFSAISGTDGTFSFYAHRLDTVVFSMLGYKQSTLVVCDTLVGKEFLTGVYLQSDTLEIGEVIIVPRFTNLKFEMMNITIKSNTQLENATTNISIASYQGRTGQNKLGDPKTNYELLRQNQMVNAYEKGGIPSDRILGLSPLLLIPAAYLLVHGIPEAPRSPEPRITGKDLEDLNQKYLEILKNRK